MSGSTTVTIRIPSKLKKRLSRLAGATARTSSWLAAQALEIYVEDQEWQVEKIRDGQADLRAGRLVSHDKVSRWVRSWGKRRNLPAPLCK